MRKIFTEKDKFDHVRYSESYVVHFSIQDDKDGFWKRQSQRYFAASKGSHKQIEAMWRKQYPKASLISIMYE